MMDSAIFQIGSIKNMKEYCFVGLYTNFHNFSQMCKFITLWSPTNKLILIYKTYLLFAFTITFTQFGTHKICFETLTKTFTTPYSAASVKIVHVGLHDSLTRMHP